jgi:hypothetical protein
MAELLKPQRGGFLRPFGCGWFIRQFLMGTGPMASPAINPGEGAPQADIFYHYKNALLREIAVGRATAAEERQASRQQRGISPSAIEKMTEKYRAVLPYKSHGCRYHSFVVYFSNLKRLGWVEFTGRVEPSSIQSYGAGQPRRYYRLTALGLAASNIAWANPYAALYGA